MREAIRNQLVADAAAALAKAGVSSLREVFAVRLESGLVRMRLLRVRDDGQIHGAYIANVDTNVAVAVAEDMLLAAASFYHHPDRKIVRWLSRDDSCGWFNLESPGEVSEQDTTLDDEGFSVPDWKPLGEILGLPVPPKRWKAGEQPANGMMVALQEAGLVPHMAGNSQP